MLKWWIAPNGEKIEVLEVLEKNLFSRRYPKPYLEECAKERQWKGTPSTTQLINGTRFEYLKLLTPYAEDPDKQAFRILGIKGHNKLELNAGANELTECGLVEDEITGIFDLLEIVDGKWCLTDHKFWGSYKVAKALGLEKKKRPMFDSEGVPVLYKRAGAWGKAGDQKQEDYFEPNENLVDIPEAELQINRYRNILEEVLSIDIPLMRIFMPIRDGNTQVAKSKGIINNTEMVYIKELDRDFVRDYFLTKKKALLDSLDAYQAEVNEKKGENKSLVDALQDDFECDYEVLEKFVPPMCSNIENWKGRRCEAYCPVSEICSKLKAETLSNIKAVDESQPKKPKVDIIERFKYLEV